MKVKLKGNFVHNEYNDKDESTKKEHFEMRPQFYDEKDIPKGYEDMYEPLTAADEETRKAFIIQEAEEIKKAKIEKEHADAVAKLEAERNEKLNPSNKAMTTGDISKKGDK